MMTDPVLRITFYTDDAVDDRAIRGMHTLTIPVITCHDVGLTVAHDREQFAYAVEHNYVLVTGNNQDYETLFYEYARAGEEHPGIVFISPKIRRSYTGIAKWLELLYNEMPPEDIRNLFWFACQFQSIWKYSRMEECNLVTEHGIVRTPDILGGKPRIAGRRIAVHQIIEDYIHYGISVEELIEAHNLTVEQIDAALAYYSNHKDDIDILIRRDGRVQENLTCVSPVHGHNDLYGKFRKFLERPDREMTAPEIAAEYGKYGATPQAVREACEAGLISARKLGATWLVRCADAKEHWGKRSKKSPPKVPKRTAELDQLGRFIRAYQRRFAVELSNVESLERPDFVVTNPITGERMGIEVTGHYLDQLEARIHYGTIQDWSEVSVSGSDERLIDTLNAVLAKKAEKSSSYTFDGRIILAVWLGSVLFNEKMDIDFVRRSLVIPENKFSEIWLILQNTEDNSPELYQLQG